ncbi:MAG: GNAT family N-acetyltransferase [Gammaproteobacteria bacterium]|nr:GNAT family N-acetyltransferase [Gammaproteobacteria bacterium]
MGDSKTRVEWYKASDLPVEVVEQWHKLYNSCISPNVYLSPDFVQAALRTFYDSDVLIACIRSINGLQAFALVEDGAPSFRFPLRSLKLVKTKHSFRSGLLLSSDIEDSSLDAFVGGLLKRAPCLQFSDFCLDTAVARKLSESANRLNLSWYENRRYDRAFLRTNMSLDEWEATIRKKKLKEMGRTQSRLKEQGDLSWRVVNGKDVDDKVIDSFLELEHKGWKGESGNSILSDAKEAEFFRRVVRNFKTRDKVFFTEVVLDDAVVASMCNFKSRDQAFAFKVAWEPALARYSPGIMNEVAFIRYLTEHDVSFDLIDSGAGPDSYINSLWPDRAPMFHGYLLRGRHAKILAWALTKSRRVKHFVSRSIGREARAA